MVDQESDAEDMMRAMLSKQKRADAEKSGRAPRPVKAVGASSSSSSSSSFVAASVVTGGYGSEASESRGGGGGMMSVVQELSQERSEFDEAEDAPHHPPQEAMLEYIGEEQSEEDAE